MDSLVKVIDNFYMKELGKYRTLRIYLPSDYYESDEKYKVIYMHDGQNLFDKEDSSYGHIWDIKKNMDNLDKDFGLKAIVVGIDSYAQTRYAEYCPFVDESMRDLMPNLSVDKKAGGEGNLYADFIVKTLKPYIDMNYKTLADRENTIICGSSMGGLISLYIATKYQEVFSKIGAMSSALYFAKDEFENYIKNVQSKQKFKIYMDVGDSESSDKTNEDFPVIYVNSNKYFYSIIKEKLFAKNENDISFSIHKGEAHNESYWDKRFPSMIKFLLLSEN